MSLLFLVLSSVLTALSMPGFLFGFLAWFSLIFLFIALEEKKALASILYGFLYFYIFSAINLYWVLPVLVENLPRTFSRFPGWLGFFAFLLMLAIEALPFALFGLLYSIGTSLRDRPWLDALFVASLYTLVDFLRGIGEMGFTGGTLADALYKDVGLLQLAPLIGSYGLTFLIVLINRLLYTTMKKSSRPIERIALVVLVIVLISYTVEHALPLPTKGETKLIALQTYVKPQEKYSSSSMELYSKLEEHLEKHSSGLIVLPEDVFPTDPKKNEVGERLRELAERRNLKILFGAISTDAGAKNSVFLVDESGVRRVYSKVKLFPFVEMLPYEKIFGVFGFLRGLTYLQPGEGFSPVKIEDYATLGIQICFESYFAEPSRQLVKKGAEVLIVCTNDGWFDYNTALIQHFSKSVFRAVETRRQVIQVSNAGVTGVVDPYGRIVKTLPVKKYDSMKIELLPREGETFYARYGDLIVWFCLAIVLLKLMLPREKNIHVRRIWR
jgi:apolipoprotein N-acyltransferase